MSMNPVQLSLDQALARREVALGDLEEHYPDFLDRARAVAEEIARKKGTVSSDDVRAVLAIPPDVHHNAMGAIFRGPRWERIDWQQSEQPQRHANRIGIWRLKRGREYVPPACDVD